MPPESSRPSRRTTLVTRAFLVVCAALAAVELVIGNGWIGMFLAIALALVGAASTRFACRGHGWLRRSSSAAR